jgi:hypothetical protein
MKTALLGLALVASLVAAAPSLAGEAPITARALALGRDADDHVHLARNDTRTAVTVYAMFLGVPKPAAANVGATAPADCHA